LRRRCTVGQPILAAAGFQPAHGRYEGVPLVRTSRLKAAAGKIARPTTIAEYLMGKLSGIRQDCTPHGRQFLQGTGSGL
jgi:hypothetical protein